MSGLVDKSGHLSEYALAALKEGTLNKAEILAASEHMSGCRLCAGKFAGSFGENELLEVPSGFKDDIAARLRPAKEEKRQFLFYSLRVAIAACAALIIVFSGTLSFIADMDSKIKGSQTGGLYLADTLNAGFQNFSQKILDLEVLVNENEKK